MSDFASVEDVIGPWLNTALSVRVLTETPPDITGQLIQLYRVGGTDDDFGIDEATVVVRCFAPGQDRTPAQALAERVRTKLREALPGTKLNGFVVSRVQTIKAPAWLPYVDTTVRVFDAAYRLTLHRQS